MTVTSNPTGVLFKDWHLAVDFGTKASFKEKQNTRKLITINGGTISYILTKKVFHFNVLNTYYILSTYLGVVDEWSKVLTSVPWPLMV